jgi:hypothetical protein
MANNGVRQDTRYTTLNAITSITAGHNGLERRHGGGVAIVMKGAGCVSMRAFIIPGILTFVR